MPTIDNVAPGTPITSAWGNDVATEVNSNCAKKSGATFTGAVLLPSPQSTNAAAATRKDYTDTKLGLAGGTTSGGININQTPTTTGDPGISLAVSGLISSGVGADTPNLYCFRYGPDGIDIGDRFISLWRAGAQIGSATIASGTSVAWNTTSDARLKERIGDVTGAADAVQQLGRLAYRGRWIADQGTGEEWVFLNSQDVESVAPYAVTGAPDAVAGPDDPEGRAQGDVIAQQLDHGALVPLLFAALSQALDRIAALEAAA